MAEIDPTASVAPSAVVTGDVTIGAGSRVLHGAVLNGDHGPIRLGADVVIMENALLRGRVDHPLTLGDAVLVGPHAHVNGATVADEVFIATGVSMFPGCSVGAGCELRINSILHVNSVLARAQWCRSDGSRPETPLDCSPRTVTTSCGRSKNRWTSPQRCTAFRAGHRCERSCDSRASTTHQTVTHR